MSFKQFRSDPLTDREKRFLRRSKGIVLPHSAAVGPKPDDRPKERDYLAPTKFVQLKKRPGRCVLSPEKRAMVDARSAAREAFFRSL